MKYVLYGIAFIVSFFLFVPLNGSSEIRNFPLFVLLVSLIVITILIRLLKYGILMSKAKKALQQMGMKHVQTYFLPWMSRFHGRYSMVFQQEGKNIQIVFLCKKKKYQRYHFERANQLEFYNTNRVVFKGSKIRGATISNEIETNMVGKQKLKWNESADCRLILFDKLPEQVTDSINRDGLDAGDRICGSNTNICDWESLVNIFDKNQN